MGPAETLFAIHNAVVGLLVGGGALYFVYYRNAARWRSLAAVYGAVPGPPGEERRFASCVLYGGGVGTNSYRGLIILGVHDNGVSLRLTPPFNGFHRPIFVPFDHIAGWQQSWYLDATSIELTLRQVPDIKIIMPAEQVTWLQDRTAGPLAITSAPSQSTDYPSTSRGLAIAQGVMAVGLLVFVIFKALLPA